MLFKNLVVFRFPTTLSFDDFEEQLAALPLKPVGPAELMSTGFVSPFGEDGQVFSHRVGNAILFTAGKEERLLPGAVVNAEVAKRAKAIEAQTDKKVKGKAKKALKEEVIFEMLPKAFVRPGRSNGYIDTARGLILLNTSSAKGAEGIVSMIREAMGSFPAVPAAATVSVTDLMTGWISGEPLPEKWTLGDACELKDPAEKGAVVRCSGQELRSEEIDKHLEAGKKATKLALQHEDRVSFTLGDDLIVRKVKILDVALGEQIGETETLEQEIDAQLALMSGEYGLLLDTLGATVAWEDADSND